MEKMRLNPYLLPHKGLRYLLAKVSLMAGNLDSNLPEEVDQLKTLSNELFFLLEQHAHVEDHMILPDLEKKCPGSTEENHEEHEYLEGLVAQLQTQVNGLQAGSNPTAFNAYFFDLSDFHAKYLTHMLMEERQVLGLIWKHYTDEELAAQHHAIISSFSPEKILRWFRYIVPALSPAERLMVLGGLKANAPKVFFDALMEVIGQEMDPRRFIVLRESLAEGALV
ncbi:MAG: hemerythrin domain-containing protein [Lunatimonas sp.]|uniref:hemerythrin domain-containing protein n=1 Tax=Lunatimonas sp. TaxID=2060141 RepID=UPI00263B326D|nr:hemerythrin domain-containing protein [Lunatimonas sp.]MCC5937122.1 hemerythrin domain-containing protein [Lunatimonas sp.]